MYGCESWTIKKAEHWKSDAFELWCWRRLLRIPWPARRSNQSILKEINPEYLLEALTVKLQYFGHLMWRADSLEKTLMLGKIEGRRRRGQQKVRLMDLSLSKFQEIVKNREAWHAAVHEIAKSWTKLSNQTTPGDLTDLKGCYWIMTLGFLTPRGEEFNLGPETRLDCSGLLCNKVFIKVWRR